MAEIGRRFKFKIYFFFESIGSNPIKDNLFVIRLKLIFLLNFLKLNNTKFIKYEKKKTILSKIYFLHFSIEFYNEKNKIKTIFFIVTLGIDAARTSISLKSIIHILRFFLKIYN